MERIWREQYVVSNIGAMDWRIQEDVNKREKTIKNMLQN
jgi:hypothetical protein